MAPNQANNNIGVSAHGVHGTVEMTTKTVPEQAQDQRLERAVAEATAPARHALHRFFYPARDRNKDYRGTSTSPGLPPDEEKEAEPKRNDDQKFVKNFWTTYDDVLILSIFTQIGIVFRLASSTWFAIFNDVFFHESALFVNLPLNCLSCFLMGMLCSGERLMEIITTRFSPPRTQNEVVLDDSSMQDVGDETDGILRDGKPCSMMSTDSQLRRRKKTEHFVSWQPPVHLNEQLRDVQLLALERRIRMSKCLLLFPLKKKDVDVMEHFFQQGYKREEQAESSPRPRRDMNDLELAEASPVAGELARTNSTEPLPDPLAGALPETRPGQAPVRLKPSQQEEGEESKAEEESPDMLTEFTANVQENVQENIERLRRVNLADGWDSGTTPEAMSDDLLLGLRDGFCGAVSSFSSWNSSMVSLMRIGHFTEAFVGYLIGLQLPIIAYRFGQHVAVYIFVWRTRRESAIAERRGGYGIRVSVDESELNEEDEEKEEKEIPSLRAIITAIFIMALVTQCTSISFYENPDYQQIALSLLFSPLGVLARWRLSKRNSWRPSFPIGTFTCNMLACALSGSLGSLLAGNPGPKERILLVSIVAGFGGTLSSLATFIVEILAGIDPILFRFDGVIYATASIGFAMVIGFVFSASVEWADETQANTIVDNGN